jgi:outer membrane protein OmpA-like peptidoglycan-associated protein
LEKILSVRKRPAAMTALGLLLASVLAACATPPAPAASTPAETAAAAPTVEAGADTPQAAPMAEPVRENSVFFASRSSDINEEGLATLRRHAERLKDNKELKVMLVGMTDDLGSRTYNLAMADRRIAAVQHQLRQLGVRPQQMRRYNAGGEQGRACTSPECRSTMRRVELRYIEKPAAAGKHHP